MNIILFETNREHYFPFTHTRIVADIRCGILTMRERWDFLAGRPVSVVTNSHLSKLFPNAKIDEAVYVNGAVFADKYLLEAIMQLQPGYRLVKDELLIAYRMAETQQEVPSEIMVYDREITALHNIWDIFSLNGAAIRADYEMLTAGKTSAPLPEGIIVSGKEHVFLEPGAKINAGCIINATTGPVYLGKSSEILEGVMMRGPVALGEKAVIKMGAKIYSDTTIGEGCKVGGEISNVVFFANSNKGHDGYLGNAVIGEWCNLGADSNCSNLKNNYDEVKIWDEQRNKLVKTGLTFCGLMMGDHSKCGINTMFNTGTVVGVSCNIYGGGFPDKYIPSFSWGGSDGMATYAIDKAIKTANKMMERRGKQLSEAETEAFKDVFLYTEKHRTLFHSKDGIVGEK